MRVPLVPRHAGSCKLRNRRNGPVPTGFVFVDLIKPVSDEWPGWCREQATLSPGAHNNGADHSRVNRARVLIGTRDGEFHLPDSPTRKHRIAD